MQKSFSTCRVETRAGGWSPVDVCTFRLPSHPPPTTHKGDAPHQPIKAMSPTFQQATKLHLSKTHLFNQIDVTDKFHIHQTFGRARKLFFTVRGISSPVQIFPTELRTVVSDYVLVSLITLPYQHSCSISWNIYSPLINESI